MALVYLGLVALFLAPSCNSMTKNERAELRETVKDMFRHAYDSYMTYAYPADELMPLTCKGRYRDVEPSRGDVDDILGNFSMTLIDSLDSLVIFGEINKFEEAVRLVIDEVDFDNDIVVSTFETNIRVVGGLLGGHVAADVLKNEGLTMNWYNDELLDMAKDIGERLMPAFNTTTGIPYPKVNLRYGVADPRSRTGTESATCTACAGTMIMEFGALSRLTGDSKFETVAHKAMKALWTYRSRSSDLVGTVINIHSGEWLRRDSGVGAGIDSYYEYCLKAYILLGEEDYLQRFNQHYKAVMRYINRDSLFLNVHMNNPSKRSVTYMDSLQAFWPGLQVLKGDLQSAIELHEVFYSVAKRHTFLPEAFTTNFEVHWGQHFLRPELVESTYFLYEATRDPYYLDVGKYIVENLNRYTRVPCGFAAVKDVRTLSHENRMDSFLLSETLMYLYLLFTDKEDIPINLHDFVFTTEAHILPLALSNWNASSSQSKIYESENLHDHSCPRTAGDGSLLSFAEKIRRKSRQSSVDGSCPKKKEEKAAFVKSTSGPPLLRAEQFIPGNKDHLLILKAMGITVTKTDDGKVQLMQDANSADNTEMAGEGVTFMQSMIELAKFRSNDAEYLPRVVQILSPPYNGNIVLNAGPAQFGIDLGKSGMGVSAEVILADPFKGCTELKNKEAADHRIVVMERGDCMFMDKVRVAESFGAVGVVIIDNNEGSSSESQPMFAMSGDGSSGDINIPAVFLFFNEGQVLQKSMQIVSSNPGGNPRVRLADKALKKDAKTEKTVPSTDSTAGQEQTEEKTNEKEQEFLQNEPVPSEKMEHVKNEVNKLINLVKNVVKQPGFEFLTGNTQLNSKASIMTGEVNTADKRERWLYDVVMENWRENAESHSGNVDEIIVRKKNGKVTVQEKTQSDDCNGGKTSKLFTNIVTRDDNEFIVVGKVDDGKLLSEETAYDVETLQQVVDEGEIRLEPAKSQDDKDAGETGKDAVITENIVSSDDALVYEKNSKPDNSQGTRVDDDTNNDRGRYTDELNDPSEPNNYEDSHLIRDDNQNDVLTETGNQDDNAYPNVPESIQDEVDQEAKGGEESDGVELKSYEESEEISNKEACESKECEKTVNRAVDENEKSIKDETNSDNTIETSQSVDKRTFNEVVQESTQNTNSGSNEAHYVFSGEVSDSHEIIGLETESEIVFQQKETVSTEDSKARTVEEIASPERESDLTQDSGEKLRQELSERTSGDYESQATAENQKDTNSESDLDISIKKESLEISADAKHVTGG